MGFTFEHLCDVSSVKVEKRLVIVCTEYSCTWLSLLVKP